MSEPPHRCSPGMCGDNDNMPEGGKERCKGVIKHVMKTWKKGNILSLTGL